MEAIIYKVKNMFMKRGYAELKSDIAEEKNKAAEKLKEMKKMQEEADKKAKKAKISSKSTKKTVNKEIPLAEEVIVLTPEEKLQEMITKNPFYYTKGFILINFPRTLEQVKIKIFPIFTYFLQNIGETIRI